MEANQKEENKNYHFVYFIESHDKSKRLEVYLSPNYKASNTLELMDEKDNSQIRNSLISRVFRFKIFPDDILKEQKKAPFKFVIIMKDKNNESNKSEYTIELRDVNNDFYEYNLKMDKVEVIPLSYEQQFNIYVDLLRNKLKKKQGCKESDEFIMSTQLLFAGAEKKFDFLFYLLIFLECFTTKIVHRHLMSFKPEKVQGLGNVKEDKMKQLKNILNLIVKRPEKIRVLNENSRKSATELFYFVVLFFDMNFQREKLNDLLGDEKIFDYLCARLIKYHDFLKNLILANSQVSTLIEKSKDFNEILISLFYVGKDFINFLQVINNKWEKIRKLYDDELKKEDKNPEPIDTEKYIIPKIEDDMMKLKEEVEKLYKNESEQMIKLIKFSPSILGKYEEYNKNKNFLNLSYLSDIFNVLRKMDNNFNLKIDDNLVHETGLNLIKEGKLKNKGVLDFICKDIFYNDKKYKSNKMYRPLDVFDGIDISSLSDDFYNYWEKINFKNMFESQITDFSNKIASLVREIKDFGLLFNFFKINSEEPIYDYGVALKKRFIELLNTYSIKTCPNFIDDTSKLIYILDKRKISPENFLKDNIGQLNPEVINSIYINIANSYPEISKETKNYIVNYIIKTQKPLGLIKFLKECKSFRQEIFSNLNKYNFQEKDFFTTNENENYSFIKGLIEERIIDQNSKEQYGNGYVKNLFAANQKLREKIENLEINYSFVNTFFKNQGNKKLEETLFDRLLHIYFLDGEKAKQNFELLKNKMSELNAFANNIQFIMRYLVAFFTQSKKEEIKEISNIFAQIKKNGLNHFENNLKDSYENYFNKYYHLGVKSIRNKNSAFFNGIYKESKNQFNNDEEKCLEDAENKFYEFKNLFEKDGIYKINQHNLEISVKALNGNENDLKKEIKILGDIFECENYDFDEIYENLLLISKKEYIFNVANAIINFVKKLRIQETMFSNDIIEISRILINNNDINNIKKSKEILYQYEIDINNKDNKFIDILLKLKQQPDSCVLLSNTTIQDCRNLQELSLEIEDNFVTVNDILDMEKCIEFLGQSKDLKKQKDIDAIKSFTIKASQTKDISIYFEKFVNNYSQINNLKSTLNKSEMLKYQIYSLFDGATFTLTNKKEESFLCKYKQKDEKSKGNKKKKEMTLKKENIIDLKTRAQLSKKMTSEYRCFIESVNEIMNISNILQDLSSKGYPRTINVKIILNIINKDQQNQKEKIDDDDEFIINNMYLKDEQQKNNSKEIIDELKNILSSFISKQKEAYEKKYLIRYIYGRQYNLLYDNFKNQNNNKDIIPLLKYITNDLYQNGVNDFIYEENDDNIDDKLNDCERFLNEVLKVNNIKIEDIYKKSLIKTNIKEKFKGVFTYLCEKLEKDLFQIFKYLTGNNPIAQNILICKKDTTNEEINAFLFRAIKCKFYSCFIIGGLEALEFEKKTFLIELLDTFFQKGNEKMNSCLIFLYTNKSSDIYKNLEMKRYRNLFNLKRNLFEKEKYEGSDIKIIKSDKSGVGKSTQIKLDIDKNKKKWIYFPFGGVLNKNDTIKRLKKLNIDKKSVIHLDLYDTDQTEIMMDFLFSILITRFYGVEEDIFYLSKDIEIKIEIPNSFINFFEKFPILTLFEVNEMKISNLSPLLVPKGLDSNIQIVANYLKSLLEKKIDNYDLFIPNVTPVDLIMDSKRIIQAIELSPQQCQKLIFDTIKETIPEPTYYQITSFINVLAVQLKKLNQNFFLNAAQLLSTNKKINHIRTFIVKSFIKITKHFTEGAFTNLLKGQEKVHKSLFGQYDEGKDINKAINDLANYSHEVISYEKIDPSLLFFHEGAGESFSIITNKKPDDREYKSLLELKNSQAFSKKEMLKSLPKYSNFNKVQFLEELKNILDIKNPVEREIQSEWKSLEEITGNYVITADNFVKMVLILLRIRSNIPVIMMGETGCGKTSLIRKLSEMKNNGHSDKMKILNIHAGTNDNDIINFINEIVIPEANKIEKINEEEKKKRMKMQQLFEEIKLWVFLDEINTCKSMGLISELMCKHTCQGKPLPSNIVFIAACNPYRQRESKGIKEEKIGLDINQAVKQKNLLNDKEKAEINKSKSNNLVYTVNPLPHSLLNFVFDFGNLTQKDEEDYIRCIIKESIEKIYFKAQKQVDINNDQKLIQLKKLAGDLIIDAHKFIREFNDRSTVSLREIRRFNIFYEFFYTYLTNRKKVIEVEKLNKLPDIDNDFYEKLDDYSLQIYSINLSVFVCYYLRITNKEMREKLLARMNKIFNQVIQKNFYDLPLREENFIVNNIKVDKGIAKNRALLENIFSLFVAINNKVPIFIVGKPGCSKSLSFQLLNKSMQGGSSEFAFLRNYPKLMVHSYQGSLISTSKGVENIFKKARSSYQKLSAEDKKKNISMIYFDEMGLAEHSPNNPLKVIHSELEYDQNEGDKKIAFVGISNWVLDASKMNRGISISIPEPNEDDNKETSLIIGKSYNENLAEINKDFYENLGLTYYKYKDYLKKKHNLDGKEDFHGNRDFYHLVKNASRNMIAKEEKEELNEDSLVECGISSIERNFAGIQFDEGDKKTSLEIFKNIFKERYPNIQVSREYNVVQRIKENINDLNSRYLLIISKSSISSFLLSSIISEEKKEYSFCVGSKFKQDLNSEEYSLKILNKMQTHMENGDIIVLNNLEAVYPAMYDLFNQNFTILGDKNYARLAIGNTINTFSLVNNNFRCIINVDLDKIDNEETPFLNRFEKHIISFEYLLNKDLIQLSEKIKSTLDELIKYNEKELKGINYDLSQLLINCNKDEIQALIYNAYKNTKEEDEIIYYVLSKISLTLPQDIIVVMNCSQFRQKNEKYYNAILDFYGKGIHTNFSDFLTYVKVNKNIVYTFSNIFEKVNLKNINNEVLGPININNIKKIQISSLKNENELERILDDFFEKESLKVCLIQFLPYEVDFMNYIKYFIEDKERNYNNKSPKCFIFVVYLSRILKDDLKNIEKKSKNEKIEIKKKILGETLSNLSGYDQIFIDNLNGDDNLQISKLIELEKKDLINSCINTDIELMSNVFTTISYMRYNIFSPYKGLNEENYINKLMELITNNKLVRDLLNDYLVKQIVNNEEDLIKKIFKDKNAFRGDEIDILSLIKINILKIYKSNLNVLFFRLEKDQFFSSLLTNSVEGDLYQQENPNNVNKIDIEEEMNLYNDKEPEKKEGVVIARNTLIEKMMKFYFENLKFSDGKTKITEKQKSNKVDIMFGFKLPGIKSILDDIIKMVKESIDDYRKNEDNLRGYYEDDEKEQQDLINKYFNKLESCDNSTLNMIEKEEKLLRILENNKESSDELYNLIINDYFTLFLNHNLNKKKNQNEENEEEKILIIDNLDENKIFLDLMVKKREQIIKNYLNKNENEKEENIKKLIAKAFNFVEGYSEEISSLQKIFSKLNMKIPELNKQIKDIIDKEEIIYEESERNPKFTVPINKVFFLSMDSILRVITSNSQIYDIRGEYSEDDLFDLINTYKEILQDALKLENSLILHSKEVFSLDEILKLFDAFNSNKIVTIENIIKIIEFFGAETYLNNDNNQEQLCIKLNEFYQFLLEKLGQNKDFNLYKVLSYLFLKEYIKISFDKYRELLLEKILNNNNFIANSSQFIGIILEKALEDDPRVIKDNLKNINEENSPLFKKINNTNNEFLDQVIMNILERKISVFFELIPELDEEILLKSYRKFLEDNKNSKSKNLTGILFGDSFDAFEELIKFLDTISTKDDNEENNKKENMHLCKLYAIVFVKMYLSKLVYFMKERYKEIGSVKEIMDVINNIKNKNLGHVIKIYIFKLLYSYLENNYEQLKNFNSQNIGITFGDQFNLDTGEEEEVMLSYFFLPLEEGDYNKYNDESSQLEILRNTKFNDTSKKFIEMIKNNDIDIFVSLTINKIISNLGLKDYLSEKNEYQLFSTWAKKLFNNDYKINENMKKLFYLFYDDKTFMEKMRGKLLDEKNIINQQLLETLLYGFRFCISTLNNDRNEKFLYRTLLQKDNNDAIKSCYIPGCDIKEDLHLETLETIELHFRLYQDACGCYVCSCGYYYNIDPCGFPTRNRTSDCPVCHKKIGYGEKVLKDKGASNHGMVIREGHYRIFKDAKQKVGQMSRWKDPDENIPNILLDEYIKKVIEPIRKKSSFGFNSVSRDFFENQNKKVRNLSNIGYRLLNFISYCHLFYGYCLGNISEENLKKNLIENMTIIKIIQTDWNLLKESLQKQNISSIQIFMNMIFKKLSQKVKNCIYLTKSEDRDNFENGVEKLIAECIKEYPNYRAKYEEENKNQLKMSNNNIKAIITELIEPSEENYKNDEYPMFKYFILTKYKTQEDFVKRMDQKPKYPLINQLLQELPGVKKLKYLPDFNEFTNYMIENYSFRISREEAKRRVLKDEEIYKSNIFKEKFKKFISSWNEIKTEAKKYKCRPEMEVKNLDHNDKLIYFLNDNGELGYGMYLAAACQNFIEWQNMFLQPIIDANNFNGILHNYVDTIQKKVPIQEAKPSQILLMHDKFEFSKFTNLNDIIYSFSERNIFNKNGKINYSDYNSFTYDYDAIEEELGKILLTGVCLFEGEDDLNFVTFWSEGFRGGRSQILSSFYLKYPQKDLNDKERENIMKYIDNKNKDKMAKNNMNYDFKEFFGSLQMLIFYLTEQGLMKKEAKIKNVIKKAPSYFKLSEDCKDFFNNEGSEITIEKLMNLFFYFEHLCFEDLADTLQNEYKKPISEETKNAIINKLLKNYNNNLFTIKDLGAAVRRFISRYLAGNLQTTDVGEDRALSFELSREDLWEEKIGKEDDLMENIDELLHDFKLNVGQAYAFYQLIGEEDKNAINQLIVEEDKNAIYQLIGGEEDQNVLNEIVEEDNNVLNEVVEENKNIIQNSENNDDFNALNLLDG